jgi:serine/threonine protein kinase
MDRETISANETKIIKHRDGVIRKVVPEIYGYSTILHEFEIMKQLSKTIISPYILDVFDCGPLPNGYFLEMENIEGAKDIYTSLSTEPEKWTFVTVSQVFQQMIRICLLLDYIKFVHGDLKLENFLVCFIRGFARVYLIDFGCSSWINPFESSKGFQKDRDCKPMENQIAMLSYWSPQCFRSICCSLESKMVWCLGICLRILLTRVHPFEFPEEQDLGERSRRHPVPATMDRTRLFPQPENKTSFPEWEIFLHDADALVREMLEFSWEKRISLLATHKRFQKLSAFKRHVRTD